MKKRVYSLIFLSVLIFGGLYAEEQAATDMPEIKDFGGFYYAYIDFHGPYSLLGEKANVFQAEFDKQGIKATGPSFVTFYNPPSIYKGYELRWAVCYPIDKKAKVKKPIVKKKARLVPSVRYIHVGPRSKIWDSFNKVQDFIKEKKFEKDWPAYEIYHQDPPGIEIIHPVKKK